MELRDCKALVHLPARGVTCTQTPSPDRSMRVRMVSRSELTCRGRDVERIAQKP